MTPRIEQPKTECPFCGLVWQEHTIKETQGCMAIMQMQLPELDEDLGVELCPVCSKLPAEHTEDNVSSCAAKWRKREEGSTGLGRLFTVGVAHSKNEEKTDPVELARLKALWNASICPCGKARGDHTWPEIVTCPQGNRGR